MVEIPLAGATAVAPVPLWLRVLRDPRLLIPAYGIACALAGVLLGIIWALAARRPGYVVREDLSAYLTERGLADVFAADALFLGLTAFFGLLAGAASWLLFRRLGWWSCVTAVVGAAIAALVTWQVGLLVRPGSFQERLSNAISGDIVPIDLELHAASALLVAPFLAITPIMLCAAFWPEDASDVIADERAGELGESD